MNAVIWKLVFECLHCTVDCLSYCIYKIGIFHIYKIGIFHIYEKGIFHTYKIGIFHINKIGTLHMPLPLYHMLHLSHLLTLVMI